jgi:nicotinate-nucleotide adenylyltransferase
MRIGIYGGTFDPVHLGHLIVAEQARVELALQQVLFVLASNPPHKREATILPDVHRLHMLKLALAGQPYFAVSTVEIDHPGISYTVDTLRHFRRLPELAAAEFFLIIGADSFLEFKNWREPQEIIKLARLAVYPRPNLDLRQIAPEFFRAAHFLRGPQIEISATDIRKRCGGGLSIRYLVPEEVRNYILEKQLYQNLDAPSGV